MLKFTSVSTLIYMRLAQETHAANRPYDIKENDHVSAIDANALYTGRIPMSCSRDDSLLQK